MRRTCFASYFGMNWIQNKLPHPPTLIAEQSPHLFSGNDRVLPGPSGPEEGRTCRTHGMTNSRSTSQLLRNSPNVPHASSKTAQCGVVEHLLCGCNQPYSHPELHLYRYPTRDDGFEELYLTSFKYGHIHCGYPPETNIAPENGWLEYYIPFVFRPIFRGDASFGRVSIR